MDSLAVEATVNLPSDNVAGIAPEILAAIEAANAGSAPSYGLAAPSPERRSMPSSPPRAAAPE